jgi:TetR/AcrR family transcriptional regulator, tetracycline repressor protein
MATQVLLECATEASTPLPKTWRALARGFAHHLRATLLKYRDGARMVAGTRLRDAAMYASTEAALRVFVDAGATPDAAAVCLKTINDYVIGFTIEQQAVISPRGERNPEYDLRKREASIDPSLYPLSRSIGGALFGDFDSTFERGLDLIVSGFEAKLAEADGSTTSSETGSDRSSPRKTRHASGAPVLRKASSTRSTGAR